MSLDLPVSVHWDYYDQVTLFDKPYTADAMRGLCRDAREAGVESLNFRVEAAGMAWVPNPVRPLYQRHDPGLALPWSDYRRRPASRTGDAARMRAAELFRQIYEICPDPLATACEAARAAGIRLNVYVCPYDQFWPGIPGTIVEQHPERCIASRDGRSRLSVPSLAYPETREWLLAYYDAVLAHDIDDVVVYSGSHAWYSYPIDSPDDWFGFEEPATAAYRENTGIDVHTQPFDINDYYRHYGTYWTLLMQELAERQERRGKRLIVGMDMGDWQVYLPWGAPRLMTTWRHRNDWRTWTAWGNVDLCVGHQVNMWEYEKWPANRLPYMPGEPDRPPYQFAEELFGRQDERGFRLYSFLTLHAGNFGVDDRAEHELRLAGTGTRECGYDGLLVREAADFEFKIGWHSLAKLAQEATHDDAE